MQHDLRIDESDRQMIALALAKLSKDRPGWDYAIGLVADKLPGGRELVDGFRQIDELPPLASR